MVFSYIHPSRLDTRIYLTAIHPFLEATHHYQLNIPL